MYNKYIFIIWRNFMYKTIKENTSAEIIEKKSKFIANLYYVQSIEEAEYILQNTRKKYYDARHNCYAYNIRTTNGDFISKSSDDGEPSGTAGKPILNIITKNELFNVLIIVTRYFGGILLGTGGLVKAYSNATLMAIQNAQFLIEETGVEMELLVDYSDFNRLNYYCNKNSLNIIRTDYGAKIKCIIEMNEQEKNKIIENINELNFKIEDYKIIKNKIIKKYWNIDVCEENLKFFP